jgi:uncharacterized Zn finger protein (UPF0148 family)
LRIRCPVCNCPIEVSEDEASVICPCCGEVLGYSAGGAFTPPEDEDSYEFLAREYDRAVEEGDYARAESLRREMERMMGETSEEEVEAIEDTEDLDETEEVFIKYGYGESEEDFEEEDDEEDFWEEEEEGFDEEEF